MAADGQGGQWRPIKPPIDEINTSGRYSATSFSLRLERQEQLPIEAIQQQEPEQEIPKIRQKEKK